MKFPLCFLCSLLFSLSGRAATITLIAPDPGEDPALFQPLAAAIVAHAHARGHACDIFTGGASVLASRLAGSLAPPGDVVFILDAPPEWSTAPTLAAWLQFPAGDTLHFIGHGTGASDLAVFAWLRPDMRVDQFTTLDPFPLTITDNVLFADNYYQTNAVFEIDRGMPIDGAYNQQVGAPPRTAPGDLLRWYIGTITNHAANGYFFTDCAHGQRPSAGYLDRQVGQPRLDFGYDQATRTFSIKFSGDATGNFYMDFSDDLKTWTLNTGNDFWFLDGRPFTVQAHSGAPGPQSTGLPGRQQFYRLRRAL